jgi:N-dimethylarginine dimethylaminohydrolase
MDIEERYKAQGPINLEELNNMFSEVKISCRDEYSKLEAVALHIPRRKEILVSDPKAVMFKEVPNYEKLIYEVDAYRKLLKSLDITVYDDSMFKDADMYGPFPNLVYMRDLAVIAPDRLILANPKYKIRKGEQEIMLATMRRNGFIGGYLDLPSDVTMEGADFFWINEKEVIISVGNRTSPEFAEIFGKLYPEINVRTVEAAAEGIPQHILGGAHIISEDTIIQRKSIVKHDLGFKNVIELEETEEVVNGYAMNIVTVSPMEIIMPSGNPDTKAIYESHGIKVHESPAFELGKMGGCFACATLPLKRKNESI